jgi:hypothetical protein
VNTKNSEIARAIQSCLISPNVCDSNLEPANVVDVIDRLASCVRYVGYAIELPHHDGEPANGLSHSVEKVAKAINNLADAVRGHRDAKP